MVERSGSELGEAIERLREHGAGSPDATGAGFADVLWQYEHGSGALELRDAWTSIAASLQVVNSSAPSHDHQLVVAYAIAEVVSSASRRALTTLDAEAIFELQSFVWRVACAWEGLLAGDNDDLLEHVRLEAWGSDIPAWP